MDTNEPIYGPGNGNSGIYEYSFQLSLNENARLILPVPVLTLANTYSQNTYGTVDKVGMVDYMNSRVNDAIDLFVKDYHDQNPK